MTAYSFLDVNAAVRGPFLSIVFDGANGIADEGISIEMIEDKNTMTLGADGGGMHSLHANNAGRVSIRLLKTNPYNHVLSAAYNAQKTSSGYWGLNTINVSNSVRGDFAIASQAAFTRQPNFTNAKDGGIVEWIFDAIFIQEILGDGTPNAA